MRNSGNGGGKRWRVQEWDGVLHGWALPRAGTLEFLNGDDTTTYDWHVSWSQSPHMTGLQVCSWAGACASLDGGKGKIYWRQDAAEEMVARGSLRGLQTGSPGRLQIRRGEYAVAGGWEDEQWGGIKERYADDLFAGRSLSKEVLGSRCAQAALAVLAAEMGKISSNGYSGPIRSSNLAASALVTPCIASKSGRSPGFITARMAVMWLSRAAL